MTVKKAQGESSEGTRSSARAILLELDNTAFSGRKLLMDVMSRILEEKGITLTRQLFVKHFLDTPPSEALAAVLNAVGKQRLSKDKLLADIEDAVKASVLENVTTVRPAFAALAKEARDRGWPVAAMTCLDTETAGKVLEQTGIAEYVNTLLSCGTETEKHFPTSDIWLRVAKHVNVSPRRAGVVASCSILVQAALSCGMRVFVTPDEFTSFQDFGGAEAVYDKFDETTVRSIVEIMAG